MLFLILLNLMLNLTFGYNGHCPSYDLISSLYQLSSSSSNSNDSNNQINCNCNPENRESVLSWEIVCFKDIEHSDDDKLFDNFQYTSVPVAFTIKYVESNFIEINCYQDPPKFQPAMFQGFGVNEIDSFYIINCPLPNIPFNIIFHRTSIGSSQEKVAGSSQVKVKKLRFLKLRSDNSVKIDLKQFKDILHGLEGLEHFSIENITIDWSANGQQKVKKRETTSSNLINSTNFSTESLTTLPSTVSSFSFTTISNIIKRSNISSNSNSSNESKESNVIILPQFSIDFSFGTYFPNLKSLSLISFLPDHPHNSFILKFILKNLKHLESLELRSNIVKHVPANLMSNSGSNLQRLYLMSNSIETLDKKSLIGLEKLEILDLFNNQLTQIPESLLSSLKNLKQLRIKHNQFQKLSSTFFKNTRHLETLDLSLNQNISHFPVNLLQPLVNLKNFSINDCNLKQITSNLGQFFSFAEKLEQIQMRNNRLTNLTISKLFGSNPNLIKLDISYNDISKLSSSIFTSNSSNLIYLNLYGNDLTILPEKIFFHLKSLKILNLGYNYLKSINENLFYTLSSLESLDLSRNQLVTINPSRSKIPFGLGTKLKTIILSENNLTQFNSEFDSINWSLLLEIEKIDLSHNSIQNEIEIPIFYSIKPKIILDFRHNLITSINIVNVWNKEKTFIDLASHDKDLIKTTNINSELKVYISNNPFNCNCHLYSFIHYLQNREVKYKNVIDQVTFDTSSDELKCSSPPNLLNKMFYELELADLHCSIENDKICPSNCFCNYQPENEQVSIKCSNQKLKSIPSDLFNLTKYENIKLADNSIIPRIKSLLFDLSENFIQDLSPLSSLLIASPLFISANQKPILIDLNLDHNNISNLPNIISSSAENQSNSSPIFLKSLSLRHNHLTLPFSQFLSDLSYFQNLFNNLTLEDKRFKLFLSHNPYNCTTDAKVLELCAILDFKRWLTVNYRSIDDIDEIKCDNLDFNSTSTIIHIPDSALCPLLQSQNQTLLLTLTITCIVLSFLLILLSILYYCNRQTILAFVYIHLNPVFVCLNFYEDDLDQDKLYDAFVSYSSADRDIVMQLIEKLEKPSSISNSSISYLQSQSGLLSIHEGNHDQLVPELDAEIKAAAEFKSSNANFDNKCFNPNTNESESDEYFNLCIHERDWLPGNLISWNIVNSVQNSRRTILILSQAFIESIWFQIEFHTAYYQMLEDKRDRLIVIIRGELPSKDHLDKDLIFLLTTKTYLVWGEKWFWEKLKYALPHKSNKRKTQSNIDESQFKIKSSFGSSVIKSLTSLHKSKQPSKNDFIKECVDQAIANHFQLSVTRKSWRLKSSPKLTSAKSTAPSLSNSNKSGHINESFVIETET